MIIGYLILIGVAIIYFGLWIDDFHQIAKRLRGGELAKYVIFRGIRDIIIISLIVLIFQYSYILDIMWQKF